MRIPVESIQYLLDVFIEGGYAEDEDLEHLDAIHEWLHNEQQERFKALRKRVSRDVNPDYPTRDEVHRSTLANHPGSPDPEWATESRLWPNPLAQERAYPTDYPEPEEDEDTTLKRLSGRGRFKITEPDGTEYYFTP